MHSKHALLFSCVDINECVEAAMNNQQICDMTQSCENTLGSVQCICPGGTQLNMQGECVALPIPTTTITSATSTSSTLSPSSTTITRVSSTALPATTLTVPAGADLNQVAVTLKGLTVASVSSFRIFL